MSGTAAPPGARAAALGILRAVEQGSAFASLLLQHLDPGMPRNETALAGELVYGCLRHRLFDEHLLAAFAGRPLGEIDPDLAIAFRIAAHQILRLDRIPDRAAVHEAVESARSLPGLGGEASRRREGGARFLNAVLRRLCRERGSLPLPPLPDAETAERSPSGAAAALQIHYSHPAWMIERWLKRFGLTETLALLAVNNTPALLSVRVDLARVSCEEAAAALAREGVSVAPSRYLPEFLRVTEGAPQRTECFRKGWLYIQDEASGIVPHLLHPAEGSRILDACASPGGKALALSRMVGRGGVVIAADIHPSRLKLIAANARRMRIGNIRCVAADVARREIAPGRFSGPPFRDVFPAILVDAPCSGSGVLRRDAETRYRLTPADLSVFASRQIAILEGAAALLAKGGKLVYSVCSIEPEEGPSVVENFLAGHADFHLGDARHSLPSHSDLFGSDGTLRTLTHRDGVDGFYAAVIVRG